MKALTHENLNVIVNKYIADKTQYRTMALSSQEYRDLRDAEFDRLWNKEGATLLTAKHYSQLHAARQLGYQSHLEVTGIEGFYWTREALEHLPKFVMHAYFEDSVWTPAVQKRWAAEGHSL